MRGGGTTLSRSVTVRTERQPPPPPLNSPANVAIACAAACVLSLVACVGGEWRVAALLLVTDGAVALAWLAGASGAGLALLRAAQIRFESTSLQIACAAALGLGVESLLVLFLGLGGAMNRVVAVAMVGVGLALFFWIIPSLLRRRAVSDADSWSWLWVLAMPALGFALACALLPPGLLWGSHEPNGYDVVEYHLQVPREWYESGRIRPLAHNVFSHFPLGVEVHYLLAMHLRGGPWAGMYVAQLMHVAFVAVSVVAVYGVARELRARHAVVGALAAAISPWLILLAPIAYNEGGLLLYGTLAIGLTLVAMRSPTPLRMIALAGAMAGFASGTKLTAVPTVLFAVPVAMIVCAFLPLPAREGRGEEALSDGSRSTPMPASSPPSTGGRGGRSRALVTAALFVAVAVVVVSPWLLRGLAWTGNPVFPEATRLLGHGHFSEAQAERWQYAHAPREDQRAPTARLDAFAKQVLLDWRFGYFLLPLGIAAAGLEWQQRETWCVLLILLLLTTVWLVFTHLQGRFFVLAIPLVGLLIAQVRNPRAAAVLAAFVVLAGVVGITNVYAKLRSNPQVFQVMGLNRLTLLTPMADVTLRDDERLILLGDARAFLYDMPMSRMQYRTVFDVPAGSDESDWMRGFEVVPGKTLVLIDPSELTRFNRTYRNLPPVPRDAMSRSDPFFERR